jgi:ABC-type nitrate/sulfonate/bicarbonate transport system permease component
MPDPRRIVSLWPQAASFAALLAVWEIANETSNPYWLPSLQSVGSSWWDLASSGAFSAATTSLRTLGIGLAVVAVLGAVLSGLLASVRLLDDALSPLINAAMSTPTVALVPVYVLIWGYSDTTRVVAIVSFSLFPLVLQWIAALRRVPAELTEMSHAFAGSRMQRVRTIVIPAVAPLLLNGARVGVVQAIKGLITSELIIGVVGVGKLIVQASDTFDMPQLYAVVLTVVAASIVSYVVLSTLESRASRWAEA